MASPLDDPEPADRLTAAALAGLAGGVLAGIALMAGGALHGLEPFAPLRLSAVPVLGDAALLPSAGPGAAWLGALLHLAGSVLFGVLFGALTRTRARPRLMLEAVAYGAAVWALLRFVVMPGGANLAFISRIPGDLHAVSCALFGLALALLLPIERRLSAARSEGVGSPQAELNPVVGVERIEIRGVGGVRRAR
jgi:hypothetical protein